tara:strand:- start:132 stop:362 length:231 start_codon:yes stop_codon:yes gene_type:complete
MKSFDGFQLRIKKPKTDVTKGNILESLTIEENNKITTKQPATRPSIPSIKFEKLIIAVANMITKKQKIKEFKNKKF